MIKVLLAEEMTLVRAGLRALLEQSGQIEVVADTGSNQEVVKLAQQYNPDVIVIGAAKPGANAVESIRRIRAALPCGRIVLLTVDTNGQQVFDALRAGIAGCIVMDATPAELLVALEGVIAGRTYLSPSLNNVAVEDYVRLGQGKHNGSELTTLSAREREVLRLIAEGHSSWIIGQRLFISGRTVDTHRHNIMKKFNIRSVAGLTKLAVRSGLSSL